jgi:hypothetical protein
MARLRCSIAKEGISTSTGGVKTMLQILAGTNQRVALREIGISFHGIVNTNEPITVDIVQQSSAGTPVGSVTAAADDADLTETPRTTGAYGPFSAEPTTGSVLRTFTVHPQTGLVYQFPRDQEIVVKAGQYLGMRVNNASTAINADAFMVFEE